MIRFLLNSSHHNHIIEANSLHDKNYVCMAKQIYAHDHEVYVVIDMYQYWK